MEGTLPAPTFVYDCAARMYNREPDRPSTRLRTGFRQSNPNNVPTPGSPKALNRYSYVLNNPPNHTDPTGMCGR